MPPKPRNWVGRARYPPAPTATSAPSRAIRRAARPCIRTALPVCRRRGQALPARAAVKSIAGDRNRSPEEQRSMSEVAAPPTKKSSRLAFGLLLAAALIWGVVLFQQWNHSPAQRHIEAGNA